MAHRGGTDWQQVRPCLGNQSERNQTLREDREAARQSKFQKGIGMTSSLIGATAHDARSKQVGTICGHTINSVVIRLPDGRRHYVPSQHIRCGSPRIAEAYRIRHALRLRIEALGRTVAEVLTIATSLQLTPREVVTELETARKESPCSLSHVAKAKRS